MRNKSIFLAFRIFKRHCRSWVKHFKGNFCHLAYFIVFFFISKWLIIQKYFSLSCNYILSVIYNYLIYITSPFGKIIPSLSLIYILLCFSIHYHVFSWLCIPMNIFYSQYSHTILLPVTINLSISKTRWGKPIKKLFKVLFKRKTVVIIFISSFQDY